MDPAQAIKPATDADTKSEKDNDEEGSKEDQDDAPKPPRTVNWII